MSNKGAMERVKIEGEALPPFSEYLSSHEFGHDISRVASLLLAIIPLGLGGGAPAKLLAANLSEATGLAQYQLNEARADPVEGMDRFKERPFDLVFTDMGMPGIPGSKVSEEIRRIDLEVPITLMTGWGSELDSERWKELGIRKVLSKPVNRVDILSSMEPVMPS